MIINRIWNNLMLRRKRVCYGKYLHINGRIFIHGIKGRIVIGNHVTINSSENANPTSGIKHTHLRTEKNGSIEIGDNVGISHANITAFSLIKIEKNVLIGSGTKIWDTDFHSVNYKNRIEKSDLDIKSAPIIIREGAFIGACSIILKGVTIGCHAVVGAGSVVTKDVPADEIWAGNPAMFIRNIEEKM